MNIDNEVLINAFKEEMSRSNSNSKWWNDHLSEQITNIFGSSMESSVKDAIYSSAKAFIDSGSLAVNQYFYSTKELSDKKEIFASATSIEKKNIFNMINKEDKQTLINNNENIELKDIYEMLTISEFEYDDKKEIVNLLDDGKIRELKKNYMDLDELLKTWLGERYEQIFGKDETVDMHQQQIPNQPQNNTVNNTDKKNDILANYMNAANKVMFFNSIANMKDKQDLFSKLDSREKSSLINDKNTTFLKSFYNNYQNKDELLGLMDQNTIRGLYGMLDSNDKKIVSNHLYSREQNAKNNINQNLNNINKETQNINNYHQAIDKSKENISNLKNERKETKLNIKNSKVTIKQLEKRKEKLERKLTNAILTKNSRISFISKRRLEKIQRISSELNLTDMSINNNQERLRNYEQQLNKVENKIVEEKNNIRTNKENISLASSRAQDYARQMYNSRVQVKGLSSFHKQLVGKKAYNHNKNNMVMTVDKSKTKALASMQQPSGLGAQRQANSNNPGINNPNNSSLSSSQRSDTIVPNNDYQGAVANDKAAQQNTPKVSQNLKRLEEILNEMGITFHPEEFVSNTQNSQYLPPNEITSMSYNQAKMMQLYFEAQYAQKMALIAKMQQEMAMGGRSLSKSKAAGFSNVLILLLLLIVLSLVGIITLLIFR